MALSKDEIAELYGRRARWYDLTANLYCLIGLREWAVRKRAVGELRLRPGGTVVEVGCGTGLNFGLLQDAIGPEGRIIGVDLTEAMLERAHDRCRKRGWANVELIRSDAAEYQFLQGVDGIISTFALTLCAGFEQVIRRGSEALGDGGRWVVADFKRPEGWRSRLTPLLLPLTKPFGVTLDLADRHPWEVMPKYLTNVEVEEWMFGYVYIASGSARPTEAPPQKEIGSA